MTKYVVQSGNLSAHPDLKRSFHMEIVSGLSNQPRFLLCSFAQPRETWETKHQGYKDSISEDLPDSMQPVFDLAIPDKFIEQCKNADVIYFHGGDDQLIQFRVKEFNLPDLFKDKVVATNSGSSDMLVSSFWTCDWRACMDGLGILPIKFIPHYQSNFGSNDPRGPIDWQKAYDELQSYGNPSLKIYALKEGEFTVVSQ